jgi:hypothetical protein
VIARGVPSAKQQAGFRFEIIARRRAGVKPNRSGLLSPLALAYNDITPANDLMSGR